MLKIEVKISTNWIDKMNGRILWCPAFYLLIFMILYMMQQDGYCV
jgi:hypothetical protein